DSDKFLNHKGVSVKKCYQCQNNIKIACSKNNENQLNSIINYLKITEIIYDSLTSLNNTNEHYKGENEELNIDLNVELSSFIDFILENDELKKIWILV
ncbi:6516_t:CDS:1, partial [Cetraspora pellucida]